MSEPHPSSAPPTEFPEKQLRHVIAHAAYYLPSQGPIGVFIHHNTLHAFQHLPFERAVVEAGEVFGAEPFLREEVFQAEVRRGRIRPEDLDRVLAGEEDAAVLTSGLRRREMRGKILKASLPVIDAATIDWQLMEDPDLSAIVREEKRWKLLMAVETLMDGFVGKRENPRPRILNADAAVQPLLIRLCSAYLDQGVSYWPMPGRERGFWQCTRELLACGGCTEPMGLTGLAAHMAKQPEDAMAAALSAVTELKISSVNWQGFIEDEFLAMPGWPGLFHCLEKDPGLAPHIALPAKLIDFLALRLQLVLLATRNGALTEASGDVSGNPQKATAVSLQLMMEAIGIESTQLAKLSDAEKFTLRDELLAFDGIERRRVYHLAYEWRHLEEVLRPIVKRRQSGVKIPQRRPAAQLFFCIDEREESIRRHLEEVDPLVETYGAAGFFGVAMHYKGADEAHAVAQCPVVVKPAHEIHERPAAGHEASMEQRQSRRRQIAAFIHNSEIASRTLIRGFVSTAVLGLFSLFPMLAKVLNPSGFAKLTGTLNDWFLTDARTELAFMRNTAASHEQTEGLLVGFEINEKVDRVAETLINAGLVKNFSRLVVVLGHGSTSLNNPHESAYDCGACGGHRGGPNARIFAAMANHPQVRKGLAERGILIHADTWFVGGYHDTCHDGIDLYDVEAVPGSHQEDLAKIRKSLDEARARNAQERSRRFEAASPYGSPRDGLLHVEERAEHLAEPRPEYGHCTNAVAIVGRRALTRGIFLDRRAFLISYDAGIDPTDEALAKVLGSLVPVCAGISLEYYFSSVDNERYGCGTKLPHNITGLMGVMNGATSDLLTGLSSQMVEIHEPVRILFIVETTPERLLGVMQCSAELKEFLENRWIRMSTTDPETGIAHYYDKGVFSEVAPADWNLEVVKHSADWYLGKMEHLPLALIEGNA